MYNIYTGLPIKETVGFIVYIFLENNILVNLHSLNDQRNTKCVINYQKKKIKPINIRIPLMKFGYIYSSVINVCPTTEFRSSIQSSIFEHHVCCGGTRDVTTYVTSCAESASGFEKQHSIIPAVGFTSRETFSDS